MQNTSTTHLIIIALLMAVTGVAVYITVTPAATAPTETQPSTPDALTESRWNWQSTYGQDGSVVSIVPNQNPFILSFTTDGRASSATDCNSMSGSYSTDSTETLSFAEFAMTMMYCEDSMEYEYSQQLSQVERFSFSGNNTLQLHLADDAGVMMFTKIE